jgi:uncharacterized protein (DUF1697 family)
VTHYLALLRGINVGGNKKIKMAELKQLLETIGLGRVQTYRRKSKSRSKMRSASPSL